MKGFNVGEQVRAKWPGSRLWYKATILEELSDGFKVKFEDGTEDELDFSDVAVSILFNTVKCCLRLLSTIVPVVQSLKAVYSSLQLESSNLSVLYSILLCDTR